MPTCVAFLRAINVTGRYIKMGKLVDHFHSIGYPGATTFINTGNVVLRTRGQPSRELETRIQEQLEPLLGFRSEVFLRTAHELRDVVAQAEDLRQYASPTSEVNVCFLQDPLSSEQQEAVLAQRSDNDHFHFATKHLYWACQVSQSQSRFSNAVLERTIKARATLRRHSTLTELLGVINGA